MKLYWAPRTRSARVLWILEEIGAPYERVRIDLEDPSSRRRPDFLAVSPLSKVPALQDGEALVNDSAAICLYLADRFPDAGLTPEPGSPLRGRYYQWMVFSPGAIEPAMVEKVGGWTPSPHRNGWGDFDRVIAQLTAAVESGPWVLGDRCTAADVMIGSSIVFMRTFGMLPDSQVLHRYADGCMERPGYQRAMEIDEAASRSQ